jgi:hypothetical protein
MLSIARETQAGLDRSSLLYGQSERSETTTLEDAAETQAQEPEEAGESEEEPVELQGERSAKCFVD